MWHPDPHINSRIDACGNCTLSPADGLPVGEFHPLQNHRRFLKIEPRIAWVELAWVSLAQVAEEIDLPLTVRKECRIQFVCVETGHRPAVQSQSACSQNEVCGLQ